MIYLPHNTYISNFQFHSFVPVLIAASHWLLKKHALFIWTSAFVIIVFRTELCILLGLMLLIELGTRRLSLGKAFIHSALAGMVALGERSVGKILIMTIDAHYFSMNIDVINFILFILISTH